MSSENRHWKLVLHYFIGWKRTSRFGKLVPEYQADTALESLTTMRKKGLQYLHKVQYVDPSLTAIETPCIKEKSPYLNILLVFVEVGLK